MMNIKVKVTKGCKDLGVRFCDRGHIVEHKRAEGMSTVRLYIGGKCLTLYSQRDPMKGLEEGGEVNLNNGNPLTKIRIKLDPKDNNGNQ